jgi:hypothetical protein
VVAEPTNRPPYTMLPAVVRGYEGTVAVAHAKGALVQVGNPSDYPVSGRPARAVRLLGAAS